MLYEVISTVIGVSGVTAGGIAASYGRQQYLLARKVAERTREERPKIEEPKSFKEPQAAAMDETSPLDYVTLGEFLWYLCNPPGTSPNKLFDAVNGFLGILEKCGLENTRATAKPLEHLTLHKFEMTGIITPKSQTALVDLMSLVRSSLENELKKRAR